MQIKPRVFFLSFFLLFILSTAVFAQNFPEKPDRLVNDYTNTLSADEVNRLEQKLVAFDDSTTNQIAIVLINSLEGYDVADYAVKLAEKWGIGSKENNNGILLLASLGDRKVTIQTGYGLEGALPDAITARIRNNEINPNFREGKFYEGLDQATDAIIAYTKGEYKADKKSEKKGESTGKGVFFIILVIILIVILSRKGGGGSPQVIGGRGEASPFWWMLMGSGMGRGSSGSSGGFGGFSGGGGGSSGGFGGFGGGSFGGGGSSGSW